MTRALPTQIQNDMKALLTKNTSLSVISKRLEVSKEVISKYKDKWFLQSKRNKGRRPTKISKTIVFDAQKGTFRCPSYCLGCTQGTSEFGI